MLGALDMAKREKEKEVPQVVPYLLLMAIPIATAISIVILTEILTGILTEIPTGILTEILTTQLIPIGQLCGVSFAVTRLKAHVCKS